MLGRGVTFLVGFAAMVLGFITDSELPSHYVFYGLAAVNYMASAALALPHVRGTDRTIMCATICLCIFAAVMFFYQATQVAGTY